MSRARHPRPRVAPVADVAPGEGMNPPGTDYDDPDAGRPAWTTAEPAESASVDAGGDGNDSGAD